MQLMHDQYIMAAGLVCELIMARHVYRIADDLSYVNEQAIMNISI